MSKIFWKTLAISPALLGAILMGATSGMAAPAAVTQIAQNNLEAAPTNTSLQPLPANNSGTPGTVNTQNLEQIIRYSNEGDNSLEQITNASQFRDVQPTDWAYEALDRVVQKYGCLVGYPDGTYRGQRALSRYEFAAGLNACLRQIEALIEAQGEKFVAKEDFEALQRLVEEFRTELATFSSRVDNLESRTAFLEAHQFSTTTKLAGEVIFAFTDTLDDKASPGIFGDRVHLELITSFTGQDALTAELAAGNLANRIGDFYGVNTFEGTQTFNVDETGNDIVLSSLNYTVPIGNTNVYISATGGVHSDYADTNNPYFEDFDGGNGALSTFASESPIYRIGGGGGAAVSFDFDKIGLSVGYLANGANDPTAGGLFNGEYAALAQLNFKPSERINLGLTYVRGFHPNGDNIFDDAVGTLPANNPDFNGAFGGEDFTTNSYGLSAAFQPFDRLSISGFVTLTEANAEVGGVDTQGEIWSYGLGLAFPNLGKEGNLLGLFAGVEPTLRGLIVNGSSTNFGRRDNAYHIEGFYKYQVTDNISITPGVIWLLSPGQDDNNDDALIGTLRTTFTF
jgi:BMFP domain-containing protein YqiC